MAKGIRQVPPDKLHLESDAGSSLQRLYYPGSLNGKARKDRPKSLRSTQVKALESRILMGFSIKNELPWLRSVKLT